MDQQPDIRNLPENIRYEIARQNMAVSFEQIKMECGLSDILAMAALDSILGSIRGNFNSSACMQAARYYGNVSDEKPETAVQ